VPGESGLHLRNPADGGRHGARDETLTEIREAAHLGAVCGRSTTRSLYIPLADGGKTEELQIPIVPISPLVLIFH
jgi:hypothetical protein